MITNLDKGTSENLGLENPGTGGEQQGKKQKRSINISQGCHCVIHVPNAQRPSGNRVPEGVLLQGFAITCGSSSLFYLEDVVSTN